jgi:hypothetical protein
MASLGFKEPISVYRYYTGAKAEFHIEFSGMDGDVAPLQVDSSSTKKCGADDGIANVTTMRDFANT